MKKLMRPAYEYCLSVAVLALVYLIAGRLGTLLALPPGYSTAVFPASGLALFALLWRGYHIWPGILLGSFALNSLISFSNHNLSFLEFYPIGLSIGLGASGEALLGAFLLQKLTDSRDPFYEVRNTAIFILLSSGVSSLVGSSFGAATLLLNGLAHWENVAAIWFTWWLGDAMGILIVTPLLLVCLELVPCRLKLVPLMEFLFLLTLLFVVNKLVFAGPGGDGSYPLSFLTFPLLVWAVFRFEKPGAVFSILMVSIISIWETVNGKGPFAIYQDPNESLLLVQIFIGVAAAMTFFLAANLLEKKRTDESLRKSEERLAKTENFSLVMVTHVSLDGRWLKVPPTLCNLLGYSEKELLAGKFKDVTHPDDFMADWRQCQRLIRGEIKSFDLEKRYIRKNGELIWVDLNCSIVEDDHGKPLHFLTYIHDITKRKKLEEALLKNSEDLEIRVKERTAELEKSNQALKDFASIASHDLQEPLRKIITYGDLLRTRLNEMNLDENYLTPIQKSAFRMKDLIDDLLLYSKISTQKVSWAHINLNYIAGEVLDDLEISLKNTSGRVVIHFLPELEADPIQMRQLFQNLISNSLKYHQEGITPVVNIDSRQSGDGFWEISVEDNGLGIDEKFSTRIFKPFERLHGRGEYNGTGMGLAICQKIVLNHGGKIYAKGQLQKGTTIRVNLPAKQA